MGGSAQYPEATSSESPFTYSVSPRYELLENSAIYARVATGFRPGGPNVLPPDVPPDTPLTYDSDSLTSYEAGFKTSAEGGKYALDLAVYYLDWEDIQLYALVNGFGINANGGTAVSKGFEFTASVVPTSRPPALAERVVRRRLPDTGHRSDLGGRHGRRRPAVRPRLELRLPGRLRVDRAERLYARRQRHRGLHRRASVRLHGSRCRRRPAHARRLRDARSPGGRLHRPLDLRALRQEPDGRDGHHVRRHRRRLPQRRTTVWA